MELATVDPSRRSRPEAELTEEELSELRSVNGALGWVARQGRADLLAQTSLIAQSTSAPKVKHLLELNKAIRDAQEGAHAPLTFHSDTGITIHNACVFTNADASLANADDPAFGEKVRSQCGHLEGICNNEVLDAQPDGRILIMEFTSATIKRACRSTLAAETNGVLEGAECAE